MAVMALLWQAKKGKKALRPVHVEIFQGFVLIYELI